MILNRIKGYISIILLVFVSLLSLSIAFIGMTNYQNTLIIKNTQYNLQSRYIAESYLMREIKKEVKEGQLKSDSLFSDLDHKIDTIKSDIKFEEIPSTLISINCLYENINSNATAILSKFNKIFYYENLVLIKEDILSSSDTKRFLDFKNNFLNKERYTGEMQLVIPKPDEYIGSIGGKASLLSNSNENNSIFIESLFSQKHFEFSNYTNIGSENNTGIISLLGTFYIDGVINLNTDLVLNGIVISNSGTLIDNGYSCKINGILIELEGDGSFPHTSILYTKSYINTYIKYLKSAFYKEILGITINSE